jgi:hypothetical protein
MEELQEPFEIDDELPEILAEKKAPLIELPRIVRSKSNFGK